MDFTGVNNNNNSYSNNESGIETMKVVEYMLSSMSTQLLHKFPDNSAFDFDYTQSSIWSPLVPHPSNPSSPAPELQRKLSYEDEEQTNVKKGKLVKKFPENVKDKISGSCVFSCFRMHHKFSNKKMIMKRRRSSFRRFDHLGSSSSGLVADPGCSSPIQSKVNILQLS